MRWEEDVGRADRVKAKLVGGWVEWAGFCGHGISYSSYSVICEFRHC